MSEISNGDLMTTLLEIKGDIGGLKATAATMAALLEKHDTRITGLEAGANRQKGAAKVVLMAGTALGTIGGIIAALIAGKGH